MREERSEPNSWEVLEATWQSDSDRSRSEVEPSPSHAGEVVGGNHHGVVFQQVVRLGRRQRTISLAIAVSEWIVALVFTVVALFWLLRGDLTLRVAGVFVLTVLFVVGLLRRRAWFDRGMGAEVPPLQYLEFLGARNSAAFQTLTLARSLLGLQVLFFLFWLPWREQEPYLPWASYSFLALFSIAFLLALRATGWYLERERKRIEQLRSELLTDD